ncbi:disease resistance protein RPS2-like [Cucurbita maxima]|uniref:Disease resistance protein RPS2-like n=2 Tax=Cucurbita TaxID=3660 RepID=A0A6J1K5D0_CUCMA|nr:disease resistance protein RPS2-like [Cucurbita maxima]
MEICSAAIVGPIGEKITNCTVDPVFRQLDYLVHFRSNVNNLSDQRKKLVETRDFVQHAVDSAKSNGDQIEGMVVEWLSITKKFCDEVDSFFNEANGRSLRWWNMLSRHRFSRRATKMATEVVKTIEEGRFERVAYRIPPQGIMMLNNSKKFEAFESRILILKEIIEALADANASVIVVHGMGGVGKTTLVEEIARLVIEGKLFDALAMTTVTQIPNVKRIQGEIADQLGLKFEEEKDRVRADRLRRRLEMEKKVLVILDDVWANLDLEDIGISSHHKGCKILVTSRKDDLYFGDFGTQKNIKIDVLAKKEARNFFNKMACDFVESSNDSDPEMEAVATELADECAGLPLALATVAQALKGKGRPIWNDALHELKFPSQPNNYGVNKEAYSSLKLSYKSLNRDEARSLFLLCSLFPQDYQINIKYLLMYAMGLGLLNGMNSLAAAKWRILSLVDELKTSYLLLDGVDSDFVKMHDIVRDTAILIASKMKSKYLVRHGAGESLWPPMDEFKDYTAISLGCSDHSELPEFICPQLRFLLLVGKRTSLRLPEKFFAGMQELRVLDLTSLCIQQLPSSIDQLVNLHTLCLDDCVLPDMSIVGELKKLEILSLRASDIIALPRVIGELTNLKVLNLSNCFKLKVIPANLLSKLTGLSELYMDNSFKHWNVGHMNEGNINARISELNYLPRLTTLHVHIPNPILLPNASVFGNLTGYRILIGDGWDWSGKFETSKTLKLKLERGNQREDAIQALLENTENLYLDELGSASARDILYSLDHKGFPKLKCLRVKNNSEIVSVVNSDSMQHLHSAFPLLESLFLKNLDELGSICRGRLPQMSFRNLKIVKVESCNRLKFVFPSFMGRGLIHLQKLEISECRAMETIVSKGIETQMQINGDKWVEKNKIEFPELRSLILQHLPELMSFYCYDSLAVPSTKRDSDQIISAIKTGFHPLLNQQVSFPKLETLKLHALNAGKIWQDQVPSSFSGVKNLTSLSVVDCASIKYLMTITVAQSLVNLERLEINNCKMMQAIIISEDKDLDNNHPSKSILQNQNVFPSLESLVVSRMDALETLWDKEATSGSFSKLKKVDIRHCKKLETVFPNFMLNRLTNLERLNVIDCSSVVEIFEVKVPVINGKQVAAIAANHLKELKLLRLPKLKHIWSTDPQRFLNYPSLQLVHTIHCRSLLNIFPLSIAKDLFQLEELKIQFCGVEEIVAKGGAEGDGDEYEDASFVLSGLTSLSLWNLFEFKRFYPGKYTLDCPSLTLLDVRHCKSFKLMEGTSESSTLSSALEKAEDDESTQRGKIERREADVLKEETFTRKEEITTTVQDNVEAELIEIRAQLQALVVGQNQMMEHLAQLTTIAREGISK